MDWIILFIISWILFFLLVDWKELKVNFWCGLLAIGLQLSVDAEGIQHHYYQMTHVVLKLWGSSAFFALGPVFVIGVLFAQYHPQKRWLSIINLVVFWAFFSAQEALLTYTHAIVYHDWKFTDSLMVNVLAFTLFSWFCTNILGKMVK